MFKDISAIDPLIVFRCKNKQCRHIFTPAAMLNDHTKKVSFECPQCGSKYEASYNEVGGNPNQHAIMLLERPKMVYLGTRIASS
ncbi:MAG: hypothetical protein ACFFDW_10215 [Candidatus Thorarchaeota archaeon]